MAQPWDYIAKIVALGDSSCGKSSLTIRLCEGRFSAVHDVTIGVEFGSRILPVGPPASLARQALNDPPRQESDQPISSAPVDPSSSPIPTKKPSSTQPAQPEQPHPRPQKHIKLSLWDTAGQETYKSVTRSYFRGASGALLVFDITRRNTFLHVTEWLHDLRQIADEGIVVILVGNKSDLAPSSTVLSEIDSSNSNNDNSSSSTSSTTSAANQRRVSRQEAQEWCTANGVMAYVETSAKNGQGVERAFLELSERIYQNIEAGKYDLNDRRSGVKGNSNVSANTARALNVGGKRVGQGNKCC